MPTGVTLSSRSTSKPPLRAGRQRLHCIIRSIRSGGDIVVTPCGSAIANEGLLQSCCSADYLSRATAANQAFISLIALRQKHNNAAAQVDRAETTVQTLTPDAERRLATLRDDSLTPVGKILPLVHRIDCRRQRGRVVEEVRRREGDGGNDAAAPGSGSPHGEASAGDDQRPLDGPEGFAGRNRKFLSTRHSTHR